MYRSDYSYGRRTNFHISYKDKCLFVIKNICGNDYNGNNVLYKEWVIYNVNTTGFTVNATSPATDVYYLSAGY